MTSKVLFVLISVLCLAFVIGKSIHLQVQDGDFAIASNGTEQVQVLVSSTEKVPLATTHLTHPDFMLLEVLVNETVLEANLTGKLF